MRRCRTILSCALAAAIHLTAARAEARVWTVDDNRVEAPAADFTAIQQAIDAAAAGDTVLVYPGEYREALRLRGREVRLTSTAPGNTAVTVATVVNAAGAGPVIQLAGNETEATEIEGLTLTGGHGDPGGGGIDGGYGFGSAATIRFNRIVRNISESGGGGIANCRGLIRANQISTNFATNGGGLANCSGVIENNEISANHAARGGGLYACPARLSKNIIEGNAALNEGGGLSRCSGELSDNTIASNDAAIGGGLTYHSGPILRNWIVDNTANYGAGLYDCRGLIQSNTIAGNAALGDGGGLYRCQTTIRDNTIQENFAGFNGGGLEACTEATILNNRLDANAAALSGGGAHACGPTFRGNVLTDNRATSGAAISGGTGLIDANRFDTNFAYQGGGAIEGFDGTIQNCLFQANRATRGAALARTRGVAQNCTFVGNAGSASDDAGRTLAPAGAALYAPAGGVVLRDSIFAANEGPLIAIQTIALAGAASPVRLQDNLIHANRGPAVMTLDGASTLATVAELETAYPFAAGNREADPLFVAPDGADGRAETYDDNDFHLRAGSPAINAGTSLVMEYLPVWDLDGNDRFVALVSDLGCYEWSPDALNATDTDGDGLDDAEELYYGSDAQVLDSDGDGATDAMELVRGTDPATPDTGTGLTVEPGYGAIQRAIMLAFNVETITVSPGVYFETLDTLGKTLTFTGSDPADAATVEATVIDAEGAGPVIAYRGNEGKSIAVTGLTLQRGYAASGGAIQAAGLALPVLDCRLTSNTATGDGGALADTTGPITGNWFEGNRAGAGGGAIANVTGDIQGNRFIGNSAAKRGGAILNSQGLITGNAFESNFCADHGGAIHSSRGAIEYNTFTANRALGDGGAILRGLKPIRYNTFIGNQASEGGALALCTGLVTGDFFTSNTAYNGGAIYSQTGDILGNRFTGNWGKYGGGALFRCTGAIDGNTFEDNRGNSGGAIVLCVGPITGNTLRRNQAPLNGGALAACVGEIAGNTIEDNTGGSGGAIWGSAGAIHDNTITGNRARLGGALYDCDGAITTNTIRLNAAEGDGGGLWGCDGRIEANAIGENSAGGSGGGIFRPGGDVINNRLIGNRSAFAGGAINGPAGTVFGNLIAGNSALYGGAVQGGSGDLWNNTIAGNTALPGGRCGGVENCTGMIMSNIFWRNGKTAISVTEEKYRPAILYSNDFWQNGEGIYLDLLRTVYTRVSEVDSRIGDADRNLEEDPRFLDPNGPDGSATAFEDADFRLSRESPLLDYGIPLGPLPSPVDLLGNPREVSARADRPLVDPGAYEFQGVRVTEPAETLTLPRGGELTVAWEMPTEILGTAVSFELWYGSRPFAPLGIGDTPTGRGRLTLRIPEGVPGNRTYEIRASSVADGRFWNSAPGQVRVVYGIAEPSGARSAAGPAWRAYR